LSSVINVVKSIRLLSNVKNQKILEKNHLKVRTQWFVYFL